MKIKESSIKGCFEVETKIFYDNRGLFLKHYNETIYKEINLNTYWPEEYYTISKKGVLRGMHFQKPPFEHFKIVHCIEGEILDVILDLRKKSNTYGCSTSFKLSAENKKIAYLAPGLAHGFYVLSEKATVLYKVSSEYNQKAEDGIRWDTFGFEWPTSNPVLSERDIKLPNFSSYITPF
jgi:dTDP-4-dehydrorhamnose 3,5-epimerase